MSVKPRYFALIPAAGVGARMGGACPKQYLQIGGEALLAHTARAFLQAPQILHTAVIVSPEDAYIESALLPAPMLTVLRCGGATRKDSVRNGLQALRDMIEDEDWVLVHDAARPGLTSAMIGSLIEHIGDNPVGGLLALPVVDTVKRASGGEVLTVPRDGLWLAQTPQMFRYRVLCDALDAANEVTDESSAIEAMGLQPMLVPGHARNLKVTLPADLALAQLYLMGQIEG